MKRVMLRVMSRLVVLAPFVVNPLFLANPRGHRPDLKATLLD